MKKINLYLKLLEKINKSYISFLKESVSNIIDTEFLTFSISKITIKGNSLEIYNEYEKIVNLKNINEGIILNKRNTTKGEIIDSISFISIQSYLKYLGKIKDYDKFISNTKIILSKYSELVPWIINNTTKINDEKLKITLNNEKWRDILKVIEYFIEKRDSNLFLRELPIKVHTKFIENNKKIIDSILIFLLKMKGQFIDNNLSFEEKYGIKTKDDFIRFRFLDKTISKNYFGVNIDDINIKVLDFSKMVFDDITIFIIENEINYLTFPKIKNSIAIFGKGYNISTLKTTKWMNNMKIYYWGDIDVHGFDIFIKFKNHFPHTKSILMSKVVYDEFQKYKVIGKIVSEQSLETILLKLDNEQKDLCKFLNDNNLRLEQENITQEYLIRELNKVL